MRAGRRYQTAAVIRHLSADDIDSASAILAAAGGPWLRIAFGRDATHGLRSLLCSGLGQDGVTTLVAAHAGDVLGVVRLRTLTPVRCKPIGPTTRRAQCAQLLLGRGSLRPGEGYVESLAVSTSARRTGIGGELIGASITAARESGATELTAWVHRGNAAALRLCARIGIDRDPSSNYSAPLAYLLGMRALRLTLTDIRPSG